MSTAYHSVKLASVLLKIERSLSDPSNLLTLQDTKKTISIACYLVKQASELLNIEKSTPDPNNLNHLTLTHTRQCLPPVIQLNNKVYR